MFGVEMLTNEKNQFFLGCHISIQSISNYFSKRLASIFWENEIVWIQNFESPWQFVLIYLCSAKILSQGKNVLHIDPSFQLFSTEFRFLCSKLCHWYVKVYWRWKVRSFFIVNEKGGFLCKFFILTVWSLYDVQN